MNGAVLVQMDETLLGKFIASKLSLMTLTQLILWPVYISVLINPHEGFSNVSLNLCPAHLF